MISLKKNFLSYIVWTLYVLFAGTLFSFMGMVMSARLGFHKHWSSILFVLLVFILVFLLCSICGALPQLFKKKSKYFNNTIVVEGIFMLLFLVIGLLLRVYSLPNAGEVADYYSAAMITENSAVSQLLQSGSNYYLITLNILFHIAGNKWIAGIWLQIALQLLGCVFLYFATRRLAGGLAALLSFGFLMVSPTSVNVGVTYTPEVLYFMIFSLALFLIVHYLGMYSSCKSRIISLFLISVVIGALVGALIYTEGIGIILLIPYFCIFGVKESNRAWYVKLLFFILMVLCLGGTFYALLYMSGNYSGLSVQDSIYQWSSSFWPRQFNFMVYFDEKYYEIWLLFAIMAFGIFSFCRRTEDENYSPWILMMFGMIAFTILGMTSGNLSVGYILLCSICIVSSLSVQEMFGFKKEIEVVRTEPQTSEQTNEALSGSLNAPLMETLNKPMNESMNESAPEQEDEIIMEPVAPEVVYIENPLPLPKKHEKKNMDYAFEPMDEHMCYDVEVDVNDDFDLND